MKRVVFFLLILLLGSGALLAQGSGGNTAALEKVLTQMDTAAGNFRTAQASFVWDQYTKVVGEHDLQKGTIYFRRESKGVQMMAEISDPGRKSVLFTDSQVQVYQPGIDQVTKYNVGKNKSEVESFLVLGFGGRGHDLAKSFNVSYAGAEKVDGVDAQKIELVPKNQALQNNFNRIVLWIDPAHGISVQQQFFSRSGDYRLAKYSNIKLNERIQNETFKLKTTPSTKVVTPSGM